MGSGPEELNHRGAGFSGIGEAVAALAVALGVLVVNPGASAPPAVLAGTLGLCLLAAGSGRWPYLGALGATAMLALVLVVDGGTDIGLGYLVPYIVVQAVATTGRWWWIGGTTAAQLLLWWVLTPRPVATSALATEVFFTLTTFGVAVVMGLSRHRVRHARQAYEVRSRQALAAMRRDIARDLHDSIAHDVTVMVLLAGRARETVGRDTEVGHHLDQIVMTGQQSIRDLHTMLAVLRRQSPEEVEDKLWDLGGPEAELERSRQRLRDAGFVADVRATGSLHGLPGLVAEVLAKCTAEAVSNVIRHGDRGTTCTVRLEVGEAEAELMVLNAVGQGPETRGSGLGLVGIRERVGAVGGTVDAGIRGGGLFSVEIAIPLRGRLVS